MRAYSQSFMTLMVPLVLLVTLFQARWGRGAVEEAMSSVVSAVMDINLKNVQLEEAQAELARVFGEGGLSGRLTGEDVGAYRLGRSWDAVLLVKCMMLWSAPITPAPPLNY